MREWILDLIFDEPFRAMMMGVGPVAAALLLWPPEMPPAASRIHPPRPMPKPPPRPGRARRCDYCEHVVSGDGVDSRGRCKNCGAKQ